MISNYNDLGGRIISFTLSQSGGTKSFSLKLNNKIQNLCIFVASTMNSIFYYADIINFGYGQFYTNLLNMSTDAAESNKLIIGADSYGYNVKINNKTSNYIMGSFIYL